MRTEAGWQLIEVGRHAILKRVIIISMQDLCRARMAAKTSMSDTGKDPSSKMPHALFSRDSESSRSSTSSWQVPKRFSY